MLLGVLHYLAQAKVGFKQLFRRINKFNKFARKSVVVLFSIHSKQNLLWENGGSQVRIFDFVLT